MTDTFRKVYTELTPTQKENVAALKNAGEDFFAFFDEVVPQDERSERARCMAIARTHIETGIMFAVKAATTQEPEPTSTVEEVAPVVSEEVQTEQVEQTPVVEETQQPQE